MSGFRWTCIALVLVIWPIQVLAANRVALVIGNSGYEHAPYLPNPKKDATDIGSALERIGFKVIHVEDQGFDDMRRALSRLSQEAFGAEMAVIYYAGHGIEIDKVNYLIPADAKLKNDLAVSYEAVPLDLAVHAVSGAKKLKLVIIDACRNNPFASTMTRTIASRAIGRGLAPIEPTGGTLVAYSAKEGTVALDGEQGRNSPYAAALLQNIEQPGLEIGFLFRKVRDAVLKQTHNAQQPFRYGSLPAEAIYLVPPNNKTTTKQDSTSTELAKLQQEFSELKKRLEAGSAGKNPARQEHTNLTQPSVNPSGPKPKPVEAVPLGRMSDEEKARHFIYAYNQAWSLKNSLALEVMRESYSNYVNYYGKKTAKKIIFKDKRKFAQRWPDRVYAARWGSIRTTCGTSCEISAVVDWYAQSKPRNAQSSGAATVRLEWDPVTEKILFESSKVIDIDRKSGTPSHIINHWGEENDACRGGAGDYPDTLSACERRNALGAKLESVGWCYGHKNENGYQHRWHPCDALSVRLFP
jgi:hypothetical protein